MLLRVDGVEYPQFFPMGDSGYNNRGTEFLSAARITAQRRPGSEVTLSNGELAKKGTIANGDPRRLSEWPSFESQVPFGGETRIVPGL